MPNIPAQKFSNPSNPINPTNEKFWGIWLPIPTILAIINSIFWTWLIVKTIGPSEPPKTTESENAVIERF